MTPPTTRYYSFSLLFISLAFFSCSGSPKKEPDGEKANVQNTTASPEATIQAKPASTVTTFEVKDSISGKRLGWGYDIIMEGGGKIHQPTIPAIQGINYFKSQEDAQKTGDFMNAKIQRYGGITGITIQELDSLGVTK